MKLAYHLWRPSQPDPRSANKIVLLHGMGGTGALWRPLAAALETDFEVLAPDQRGHGGSRLSAGAGTRNPLTYTPLDYGRDLVETLEDLGFHPAWVLGHSMGVRSACALAHLRPEFVRGLMLVDLGFAGVAGGGLGEDLARFVTRLPERFGSRQAAREFMAAQCPDPSIGQYLMAVSAPTPEGGVSFPFDHSALIQTIHAARDISIRGWVEEFGRQGMPVRVLRGSESRVWSHQEFEGEKARFRAFPSIRFEEIPGAGHGLPFEQRARLVNEIRGLTGSN